MCSCLENAQAQNIADCDRPGGSFEINANFYFCERSQVKP